VNQTGEAGKGGDAGELSFLLGVVGNHRALVGERDRLARRLAGRRRRQLVAATDNRLAIGPDFSR
jgi:hypothetical protein